MARIHITTDEGSVFEFLADEDDQIGNTQRSINRSRLASEIMDAVERARLREGRDPETGKRA